MSHHIVNESRNPLKKPMVYDSDGLLPIILMCSIKAYLGVSLWACNRSAIEWCSQKPSMLLFVSNAQTKGAELDSCRKSVNNCDAWLVRFFTSATSAGVGFMLISNV